MEITITKTDNGFLLNTEGAGHFYYHDAADLMHEVIKKLFLTVDKSVGKQLGDLQEIHDVVSFYIANSGGFNDRP